MYNNSFKLKLDKNTDNKTISMKIDSALLMGFYTTSALFPITSYNDGVEYAKNTNQLKEFIKPIKKDIPSDYISSTKSAHKIPEFKKENMLLEGFFSNGEFFRDLDNDCLADNINFKIVLPENPSIEIIEAACNFAFRVGMETTKCETGLLVEPNYNGNSVRFSISDICEIYIDEDTEGKHLFIKGNKNDIVDFVCKFLNEFPNVKYGYSWENAVCEMENSFKLKNLDGQISFAKSINSNGKNKIAYCEPSCEKLSSEIKDLINETDFINYKGLKEAYTDEYDIPWEVDKFEEILNDKLYSQIKENDKIEIFASLSEDIEIRNKLQKNIKAIVSEKNAELSNLQITCAYKQGFSWIEDYVIPKLINTNAKKVKILFKAFLPQGETIWKDEDGATPSYNNLGADTPDKWYDLPIRFLQELYPIDDLISQKLGISTDDITFEEYKGTDDITYEILAIDNDENNIFTDNYKVYVNERPFLDDYKGMGKVHPATGFVKIIKNGEIIIDQVIKTDIENIWDKFNGEVLRKAKEHITNKIGTEISYDNQPFFSQIKLEAYISEPERKLPIREDLISPLDALHEDMYFVATDFFKNLGNDLCGKPFDAPGLILPVLHIREGKSSFKVTLYDKNMDSPCVVIDDEKFEINRQNTDIKVNVSNITYENNTLIPTLSVNGVDEKFIKAYAELLEKNALHINEFFENTEKIIFKSNTEKYIANLPEYKNIIKNKNINDIDIMEGKVIGYDDYIHIINQLKYVDGIEVYEIGRSYNDRIVYAVDILPKNENGYVSRLKRLSFYPSEISNCRHHANEVSSTNASFMIIKEILNNKKYENLGDKVNLTIVPVENTDGTAIHEFLSAEHPNWKFHVARFDAVSKEFFHDVFNKDTIHTEALAFRKIYENKLPDLVVDNHGVPSHEWEQQYSGYTSPSFKGFWLPRSILYGYFWTVNQKEFSDNQVLAKEIEHQVAVAIEKDKEMTALNIEMANRFEKYAHMWLPKLFPANYYMNMINYWVNRDFDMTQRYVSHRHPWITTTYYTSEVADETAQGDYLRLCAKAHFTHNMAILDIMSNAKLVFENQVDFQDDKLSVNLIRQRPILV